MPARQSANRGETAERPQAPLIVVMLLERAETQHDGRVRREIRSLTGAGLEVVLLHRGDGDEQPALRADGAMPRSVRPGGLGGRLLDRLPAVARRLALWGAYAWHAARARPDVVHAHDLPMLLPGWLAARASRAALVYDTHEYAAGVPYHSALARRVVRALEGGLAGRCQVIVAVSPQAADLLRGDHRLATAPVVVRNVPLLDWDGAPRARAPVADLRAELGIGGAPLVLHQGAATVGRGCVELIEAVAGLDGTHLLFLGDAENGFDADLRAAAVASGAAGRVHFRSSVPLEVLLAHTRQADAGVCLSDPAWANHRVTLSNKLFEYIAAGLPVVATSGTAFGDLVERLAIGFTVPFGDRAALAAGVARALGARADPPLRARLADAGSRLHWDLEQEVLLEAYRRLPRRRSRRQPPRSAV